MATALHLTILGAPGNEYCYVSPEWLLTYLIRCGAVRVEVVE